MPDQEPRRVELTAQKCMEYGMMAYARHAPQDTAGYNPLGSTGQKGCANCLFYLPGMDSCGVVDNYPAPITPNGLCTAYWTAIPTWAPTPVEVIIVGGSLGEPDEDDNEGMGTGMMALGDKATKTEGGVEYQASDYAVAPDDTKPSGWKLRLAEGKSGAFTVAQVGRAITAMQPSGFRGNKVTLSAADKKQAVSRIGAAIGKSGGDKAQQAGLRDRLDAVKGRSGGGDGDGGDAGLGARLLAGVKALFETAGVHLPALEVPPAAEASPVMRGAPLQLTKDTAGEWRWFAFVSNNGRDRDHPAQIISDAAHKDYVAYLDGGGAWPEAQLWHTPGTRWGVADWVDYSDGVLALSGTVDKGCEDVAEALASEEVGVSHGFRFLYSDKANEVIGWYRSYEISALPPWAAANEYTGMDVLQEKEAGGMAFSPAKRQWLTEKVGADKVADLETKGGDVAAALAAAGVERKDIPQGVLDDAPPQLTAKDIGEAAVKALTESSAFKGLSDGMAGLTAKLEAQEVRLKAVERSDDEKIAAAFTPRAGQGTNGYRATQATGTQVKAGDELATAAPNNDQSWLEKALP